MDGLNKNDHFMDKLNVFKRITVSNIFSSLVRTFRHFLLSFTFALFDSICPIIVVRNKNGTMYFSLK